MVPPKQASDDYGYRLGKRYIVYKVVVTNASSDFEYEISDILVDLKPLMKVDYPPGSNPKRRILLGDDGKPVDPDTKTITRRARKAYIPAHPLGEGKRKFWRF